MEEFENQYVEAMQDEEYMKMMESGVEEIDGSIAGGINGEYRPIEDEGPTVEDIDIWKKQYPTAKIFRTVIAGEQYIYKTLNRVEYKNIISRNDLNAITREEVITHTCCLWPRLDAKAIGEGPAGNVASLAQIIMRTSGFDEPEELERLA